jgi:SAM-dependent methyltransferase
MESLKRAIPSWLRRWLSRKRFEFGRSALWADRVTDFATLRRVTPYRPDFGWHRGQCIDRYYIERFLAEHADDIHGRVLEIGDPEYTTKFGGDRVTRSDVIDLDANNPRATIHDDLCAATTIADGTFDCILCPQTLLFILDFQAVISTMHRILKPGGVLLATMPGIAQICPQPMIGGAGRDYWRFTDLSARAAFANVFADTNVRVKTYGNVLAAVALLHGLVSEELSAEELDHHDPAYQVTIAVCARKELA